MTSRSPFIAKISAPELAQVLPRTRLFRSLDRHRGRRIFWVSGPPGAGKTTLVASYIERRRLRCLWYQVDEGDADLGTFFHYMGLAARRAAPRIRRPLPHLTPEYIPGLAAFTRRYFEDLFGRLTPPFVVVFDNYQEAAPDAKFHEVIRDGLREIPDGGRVILISRSDPPLAFSRWQAHQAIAQLGWDDLRLTESEARGIARLSRKRASPQTLQELHHRTQGWVAGLVLMLERVGENPGALPSTGPTRQVLFDYFAGEIFDKTDDRMREVLLHTAFLPKLTAPLAEQLTGQRGAGRILSELSRKNYFTVRHVTTEQVYQYHPLFREFLLSRGRQTYTPAHLSQIQRKAAALLEETGQVEDAIGLLREARDWEGMAQTILKHAVPLLEQGRNRTVEEWLSSVPREILDKSPWLLHWQGVCRVPFNTAEARGCFERAFALFQEQHDLPGIFLAWSGVVSSIWYEQGTFKTLDRWIAWLDDRVRQDPTFPSPDIEARVLCSMVSALLFRQPQRADIDTWMEWAERAAQKTADISLKVQIGHTVAFYHFWRGQFAQGKLAIETMGKTAEMPRSSPLSVLTCKLVEAFHDLWVVSPDRCLQTVSEALRIGRDTGVHIHDYWFFAQGVYSALSKGDLGIAEDFLGQMRSALQQTGILNVSHYHHLAGWHALLLEDIPLAASHAARSLDLAVEAGAPLPEALCRIGVAQVSFEQGDHHAADVHLEQVFRTARETRSLYLELIYWFVSAQFALVRGRESQAVEALRKGMALGRERRLFLTTWWRPAVMARLCEKALEQNIEVEYVQDLIRKRHLMPEESSVGIERWPWPVKIYTLGRLSVLKDGRPLQFTGKMQRKPLELLQALIAYGGRLVREDQLVEALWPDAEGDAAHRSFATTLHRLRKLAGHDAAIVLKGNRLSLDPRRCWVDVWAFERLLGTMDSTLKENRTGTVQDDTVSRMSEKALALYRGPFLGGESGPAWAIPLHERLRSKFLRHLGELGRRWENEGQWDRAVTLYQKGLEVERLAEEFSQRLMICHQRLGRPAEALATYHRCRASLATALGVAPSAETEAIYRALHQK